jgi:hypothetical protein
MIVGWNGTHRQAHPASSGRLSPLFSDELIEVVRSCDLLFLNLECCVSDRGERWHNPHKP